MVFTFAQYIQMQYNFSDASRSFLGYSFGLWCMHTFFYHIYTYTNPTKLPVEASGDTVTKRCVCVCFCLISTLIESKKINNDYCKTVRLMLLYLD